MDAESPETLEARLLKLDLSTMAWIQNSPEYRGCILKSNEVAVERMLEQAHASKWARLNTKRDRNILFIKWKFNTALGDSKRYSVSGKVTIIPIVPNPDPEKLLWTHIVSTHGDGETALKLKEGLSYCFHFFFIDILNFGPGKVEGNVDSIMFQTAMPMSEETETLLKRAIESKRDPAIERLKEDLDIIRRKKSAFNERLRQGIEEIKAQGLPPDEEQKEIEDFKDEAEIIKEKHGI